MPALTIREQIMRALKAELETIGVTCTRAPIADFDMDELPALGLFAGDEESREGPTMNTCIEHMEVTIAGHATGASGEAAETAANELYGQALAAVMADYTHGGLAVNSQKTALMATLNYGADGEAPLAGFELSLDIEYWTLGDDPTASAP
jgi:hypothetical protein